MLVQLVKQPVPALATGPGIGWFEIWPTPGVIAILELVIIQQDTQPFRSPHA